VVPAEEPAVPPLPVPVVPADPEEPAADEPALAPEPPVPTLPATPPLVPAVLDEPPVDPPDPPVPVAPGSDEIQPEMPVTARPKPATTTTMLFCRTRMGNTSAFIDADQCAVAALPEISPGSFLECAALSGSLKLTATRR
jgi:hypothetical protein